MLPLLERMHIRAVKYVQHKRTLGTYTVGCETSYRWCQHETRPLARPNAVKLSETLNFLYVKMKAHHFMSFKVLVPIYMWWILSIWLYRKLFSIQVLIPNNLRCLLFSIMNHTSPMCGGHKVGLMFNFTVSREFRSLLLCNVTADFTQTLTCLFIEKWSPSR